MNVSPRRRLAATLITGAAALAVVPGASAAGVGDASLEWHTIKQTANPSGSPTPPPKRTWLGYVAGTAQQFMGKGTASATAPATGTSIPNGVADGTAADWTYPVDRSIATNAFDAAGRTGTIEFDGTVRFDFTPTGQSSPWAAEITDPVIQLDGNAGKLFASGRSGSAADATYDRSQSVFDLDLTSAAVTTVDHVTTITGIHAKNTVTGRPFAPNYAAGTGGPRTDAEPFFGTFDLTVTDAPTVIVSKTADIASTGEDVTVTGAGFKTTAQAPGDLDNAGVYVALVGPNFDTSSMGSPSGSATYIPQSALTAAGGTFTRTLNLKSSFGTGEDTVDCLQVACRIYTWKAHRDTDPSQRVSVPVTFKAPTVDPEPTPDPGTTTPPVTTPPATTAPVTTPPAVTPPVVTPPVEEVSAAPKVSKAKVASRRKLTFRVDEAGTVTATVQKRVVKRVKGQRVLRWKKVRVLERDVRKAGTVSLNPKLGRKGSFRIVLRTVSTTGKNGKTVVVKKRFK